MTITYHRDLDQGSDAWLAIRCGMLTASEMKHIITPTLMIAENDKKRTHFNELLAQRITGYVEPQYISDDMLRGQQDEIDARALYAEHYAPVEECGFVTNDEWGFTLGCSPDGLVGDDGMIECKSRRQRFQVDTILDGVMPSDYLMQVQTAMLVTGRAWCDFVSYSGGLPMVTIRVHADDEIQGAIVKAATLFESRLHDSVQDYARIHSAREKYRLIPTERRILQEIF